MLIGGKKLAVIKPSSTLPLGNVAEYRMQSANMLKYSEDFSNAVWTKASGCTVIGKEITTTITTNYFYQTFSVVAGLTYSIRFKSTAGTAVSPTYRLYDASNTTFIIGATGYTVGDTVSITVTAPAGCTSIRAYPVFNVGTIGTITISEIQASLGAVLPTYEKTTDLQSIWNSKLSQMAVSNLALCGNFALDTNADGVADNWSISGSTSAKSVANNIQSFTASAQNTFLRQILTRVVGHKYFYAVWVKAGSNLVMLNNGVSACTHSGSGNFERLWYIDTAPNTGSPSLSLYDTRASGWTEIQVKEAVNIDLTDLFGAGFEPTLAQCGKMFANGFDGTQNMMLPKYNGYNGSTSAPTGDVNDFVWQGDKASPTVSQYGKLPYTIDVNSDFTLYAVVYINPSAPASSEAYWSFGNSGVSTQYLYLSRSTTGNLVVSTINDAGANDGTTSIAGGSLISGVRLLKVQVKSGKLTLKDVGGSQISNETTLSGTRTFNQLSIGALVRATASLYTNQPIYSIVQYPFATSESYDKQVLRAERKRLKAWGVTL